MQEPQANTVGLDFATYSEDPDIMFDAQLRFQRWYRHNLLHDGDLGMPERWHVYVDFQNCYEAAWFGCPVEYHAGEVPDTRPAFTERPEALLDRGLPDPFGGFMGRGLEYHARMAERAERETFLDLPISAAAPGFGMGTDGPMTVACSLFGAGFVCETMATDPERMWRLLAFITEATIVRMEAFRRRYGVPVPQEGFGMADDSIALISTRMYREHILPHHRRIFDHFATPGPRSIHLCGNATRHFRTIRDELNVMTFDTGFPVDFAWVREQVGPDVRLLGGPHVEFLISATAPEVREECRRILSSGVLEGGRFVLREGNNLAPRTPLPNVAAMYFAAREFGVLEAGQ